MVDKTAILRNYIFYTICEKVVEQFDLTYYTTIEGFCSVLSTGITLNNLTWQERWHIAKINQHVCLVYGLNYNEGLEYVLDFFTENKICEYENIVRMVKEYFPNSFM